MKLVNIHNRGRTLYLFCRDENGKLEITEDKSFYPYYFEPAKEGDSKGFDGTTLKKMFVTKPSEVKQQRSIGAYEADIIFTKRYLIDKVPKLEKTIIKYCFIDIETIAPKLPDVTRAQYPIGCISIYNSLSGQRQTFRLDQYETEWEMLEDFMTYMKKESFDLWLSWNVDFDYNYLHNRIPDFAQKISPIDQTRYGKDDIQYPAGMGIADYLQWFKKITLNKAKSYALDSVGEEYLGKGKTYKKVDFSTFNEDLIKRNIEDVEMMIKLEKKFQMVPYFDELRRLAKVDWEDMYFNSRIVDMLLLQEAHDRGVALPMKPHENEKEEFEGAYREAFETGRFYEIGKYDLSSAYPNMIIDFCLDPANVIKNNIEKEQFTSCGIENSIFSQNSNALLPTICKRLLNLKDEIKEKLKATSLDTFEHRDIQKKYDAVKAVVNSAYGVMGNRFFRLYDPRVASATTFLVRNLLHYVKDRVEADGRKIIYIDTDSVFIEGSEDLTEYMNEIISDWGQKNWNKFHISTQFEFEGTYQKILILAKCRYIGYLRTDKGIEVEIKGVEAKRKDSTVFMKKFQKTLIDKVLDKEPQESIFNWIRSEIERVRTLPLSEVAFPCKLGREPSKYVNMPIFLRALQATENLEKQVGDPFFYIYVKPEYYVVEQTVIEYYREVPGKREGTTKKEKLSKKAIEEFLIEQKLELDQALEKGFIKKAERITKTKKAHDVKAFDEETQNTIEDVDWPKMIDRNVYMKLDTIFQALKWDLEEIKNAVV